MLGSRPIRDRQGRPVKTIEPPDIFHLQAAQGWLELGSHTEAELELRNLAPELSEHPAVLQVRWAVCAAGRNWEAALEIAATLIQLAPADPFGWIHRSYSLHELKQTAEARDNLLRAVDKFPDDPTMRYNLACYECQLGRLDEATGWLRKAFALGDARMMKLTALDDPDLKPLRVEIESL
jgi:tetratricopeptide (TPR) repeat protein